MGYYLPTMGWGRGHTLRKYAVLDTRETVRRIKRSGTNNRQRMVRIIGTAVRIITRRCYKGTYSGRFLPILKPYSSRAQGLLTRYSQGTHMVFKGYSRVPRLWPASAERPSAGGDEAVGGDRLRRHIVRDPQWRHQAHICMREHP